MEYLLIGIYGLAMSFIFIYSIAQIHLSVLYRRKRNTPLTPSPQMEGFPFVTVQLPLYNEKYVVRRLIEACAAFDYPKDRFEIQVLDDSTDDSVEITESAVKEAIEIFGVQIFHVRREKRTGFKAGALAHGLKTARGEFVAIFDADFLPDKDFLRQTIPWFTDKNIGVVQTRWGHINEKYSLLTRLQAFALDAHFTVEQSGRNAGGFFINFNGTAGVWRRACIEDAGGWQSDTLTEDLDLSYRAQLKGWQFRYLEHVKAPAELPAVMKAIKSQQYRWTKGAAETARKHIGKIFSNPLGFGRRFHAIWHLMNSMIFICIFIGAMLSIPMLWFKIIRPGLGPVFNAGSVFLTGFLFISIYFWTSWSYDKEKNFLSVLKFLVTYPLFLMVSMGLSLHNAIAVAEGYLGIRSPFVRTPKFNILSVKDQWNKNQYLDTKVSWITVIEGLLSIYFAGGLWLALRHGEYALLPFHLMLTLGFGLVFYYSLRHALVRR